MSAFDPVPPNKPSSPRYAPASMRLSKMSRPLEIDPIVLAVNTPRNEPPVVSDVTAPANDALQFTVAANTFSVSPSPLIDHAPRLITPDMFTGPRVGRPPPRPVR